VGPRAGLDRRKISSQPDLIPDHPAHSQSLYQLHYTHTHYSPISNVAHHYILDHCNNLPLTQPTTPTGLVLWQFLHPQPSHYKGMHTHCISRVQKELYELASTVFKLAFSVHSIFPYFSHVTCFPLITANLCYLLFYSPQPENSSKLERFQLNQYFIHD
jgi:hypothetical protein